MKTYLLIPLLATLSTSVFAEVKNAQPSNRQPQPVKAQIAPITLAQSGNSKADSVLQKFVAANNNNPAAVAAANSAAADIKSNPEKFVNPDGSIKMQALEKVLADNKAGNITVPSPSSLASGSNR